MGDSAAAYIHMVHHLIEECMVFSMNKEECMEALAKHANIKPVVTSIVWKELEKENKEFFEAYTRRIEQRAKEMETREGVRNSVISDSSNVDVNDVPLP